MRALTLTAPFYVTSDSHFLHARISEYQQRPPDVDRMMVERWRETVPPEATVLHLGDLHLGKKEDMLPIARELTGARKLLLLGNHDRTGRTGVEWYESLGFEVLGEGPLAWHYQGWQIVFNHEPYWLALQQGNRCLCVHGHVHRASKENRRMINVSVEVTGYRPVEITTLLDARIAELARAGRRPRRRSVAVPASQIRYSRSG